jgi:hypothetical protein
MASSSVISAKEEWKAHKDLARRFEFEASRVADLVQKSRYFRLAGQHYGLATILAPYDRQDLMAARAARCFDAAASLTTEVA